MYSLTKRQIKIIIITIAIILLWRYVISPISYQQDFPTHKCIDTTHLTCDGNCSCDGLGCN